MSSAIILLFIIFIMWQLLVKGWLWKITVGIFGWAGMHWALSYYIPGSSNQCLTIAGASISWAVTLPSIVLFMSMLYTKE